MSSSVSPTPTPRRTSGGSAALEPPNLRPAGGRIDYFDTVAFDTTGEHDLPPPEPRVIQRLALFAFDVLQGIRSVAHLAAWITPSVAASLSERRAARIERRSLYRDQRRVVATPGPVHIDRPETDVIEAAVTLFTAARTHAVALRLECRGGRWRATELVIL